MKMTSSRSRKPVYHISLEYLARRSTTNSEFKYTLHVANKYHPIFDDGMTLLELAVDYNNLGLIEYLSSADTDYDVDTQNSTGNTALIVALNTNKFEAVKILLDAGADVRVTDASTGKTALGLLTRKQDRAIKDLVPHLLNNLKKSNLDAGTAAELLVAADCPFEHVLAMNDPRLSREFLARSPSANYRSAMIVAVKNYDLASVRSILHQGNNATGTVTFYGKLNLLCSSEQMRLWKMFVELLSNCDVGLQQISYMFEALEAEHIRVMLDCKIDAQVRDKFAVDLRVRLFGNRRIDAVELLKNRDFHVNARDECRKTALHHAANGANVRYLLDSGADLDATDDRGRTALFDCADRRSSTEDGLVLLEHGADVQIVDVNGLTVLEFARRNDSALLEFLLAKLAIIDRVEGVPIKRVIRKQIDADEDCKSTFGAYCRQIEALKTREIVRSVTFHAVLTDKIETLYRALCDEDTCLEVLEQYEKQHDLHSLYYSIMKGKLKRIENLHRFACRIADFISESTGIYVDFDHLVVRKILGYLTVRDIEKFVISAS